MPTEIVAPDFRDVIEDVSSFSTLMEERLSLKAQQKDIEDRLKALDESITAILTESDAPKVQYGDVGVSLVEGSRSTLSKERLVELGVPVTIVQQATKTTKFTYVLVR